MQSSRARKLLARFCFLALLVGGCACRLEARNAAEPSFSGGRAFEDLRRLVEFGPRPSGSPELAKAREWMVGQLRLTGATVEKDSFVASTPIGQLSMTNLIVKIPGARPDVVIVAGHYDTARIPGVAFVGANDGGSSAALLLELARVLSRRKNPLTIWLVFFDGEEATQRWTETDSLYGSRHLAQQLSASGELGRVQAMILVDMIGAAHLEIHPDENSTSWLNSLVFQAADRLGYNRYFPRDSVGMDDDHIPFVNAGVSAVDIISLHYGPDKEPFGSYWHSAQDTVEHCSPTSLTIVGRVVLATLDELANSPHLK